MSILKNANGLVVQIDPNEKLLVFRGAHGAKFGRSPPECLY